MKITVLVDNNVQEVNVFGEWGLSLLIEEQENRVLFDMGASDLFIANARELGVGFRNLTHVAFSHGHDDHTGGLGEFMRLYENHLVKLTDRPTFLVHPHTLLPKMRKDGTFFGSLFPAEVVGQHFSLQMSKEPVWLSDRLVYLGEIPRTNDFENQSPIGKVQLNDTLIDDYLRDDTGFAYKSSQGLVVIVGCSHSGICNIVEYARKVCDDERVLDIVGGFHLLNPKPEVLRGTVEYMRQLQPVHLHATHCTDLRSKLALAQVANIEEIGVGSVLKYD